MSVVGVLEVQLLAEIGRLSNDMKRAERVVSDSTNAMTKSVTKLESQFGRLGSSLSLVVAFDTVRRLTDDYVKLTAQLHIATKSQAEFAQGMSDVKRISTLAQADINATTFLYTRLTDALSAQGVSQKSVANITEAVGLGLKAYGATAAEASSAMLQLSQAFASNRLGGEEFRAVSESMPNLMAVLAKSMGVPRGELRALSIQGKITAAEMAKAWDNPEVIAALTVQANMTRTITGEFIVLRNEIKLLVGEFMGSSGATSGISSAIKLLSDGVGLLAKNLSLLIAVTAVYAGILIAQVVAGAASAIASFVALNVAHSKALIMNLALAKAEQARIALMIQSTAATVPALVAELQYVMAMESVAATTATANAMATQRIALQARLAAIETANVIAESSLATATAATASAQTLASASGSIWTKTLFGTSVAANLATGSITKLGLALNVLLAAWVGWEIGSWLNKFEDVRAVGLITIGALMVGFERLKFSALVAGLAIKQLVPGSEAFAPAYAKLAAAHDKEIKLIKEQTQAFVLMELAGNISTPDKPKAAPLLRTVKVEATRDFDPEADFFDAVEAAREANRIKRQSAFEAEIQSRQKSIDGVIAGLEKEVAIHGKTAGQIRLYEAAQLGATKAELDRIEVLSNLAEDVKANKDFLKIMREEGEKDDAAFLLEQQKTAEEAAAVWKRFQENVQRNMGDVLYLGLQGKFKDIGDMFKQLLLRMTADAMSARLAQAMFGAGGVGAALFGTAANATTGAGITAGSISSGGMGAAMMAATPYVVGIAAAYVVAKYGFGLGNKRENVGGNRLVGEFTREGFSGNRQQSWELDRGAFRSGRSGTDITAVSTAESRALLRTVNDLQRTFDSLGDAIGQASVRTKQWNVGMNMAGDITNALADGIGRQLVPALTSFREAGENLAQTAKRLTTIFQGTSFFINALGLSAVSAFGAIGIASTGARNRLVDAAGGLDAFNQKASFFVSNFLTDAEKLAPSLDKVGRTFLELGIVGIETNEQFAAAIKLATLEKDYKKVDRLFEVAEAFNNITTEAKKTTDQLLALIKTNTFSSLVDYQRAVGLASAPGVAGAGAGAMIQAATTAAVPVMAAESGANSAIDSLIAQWDESHQLRLPKFGSAISSAMTRARRERERNAYISSLIPSMDVGTNFLPKDMPIMAHQGERIIPRADNRELMNRLQNPQANNEALLSEIRSLRQEVANLQAANVSIALNTNRSAKVLERFDGNGMPAERDV